MARSFNGTTDKINCGAGASVGASNAWTASGWLYLTGANAFNQSVVGKRDAFSVGNDQYFLGTDGSGRLVITVNAQFGSANTVLSLNAWHSCIAACDSSSATVYLDGTLQTNTAGTPFLATPWASGSGTGQAAGIGALITEAAQFTTGRIADVAVWNVKLTGPEIVSLSKGARPGTIRPANLVLWCPLDGLQSPEPDLSSFKNNGTLTGTALAPGPPVAPFTRRSPPILLPVEGISGARRFNGTTDKIALGTGLGISNLVSFSVVGWAYPTAFTAANGFIFSLNNGANWCELSVKSTQKLEFDAHCGANFQDSVGATSLSANTWAHVAATYNAAAGGIVYLNGVNDGHDSTNVTNITGGAINSNIGCRGDSGAGTFFSGRLADVAIWNVALTPAEVLALSQGARPFQIRPGSLLGYWPVDGLQSPEPDLSSKNHNGTVTGTVPVPGPPISPFSPRWPQNLDIVAAPSFNPAWRVPFNQVVSGGVAT